MRSIPDADVSGKKSSRRSDGVTPAELATGLAILLLMGGSLALVVAQLGDGDGASQEQAGVKSSAGAAVQSPALARAVVVKRALPVLPETAAPSEQQRSATRTRELVVATQSVASSSDDFARAAMANPPQLRADDPFPAAGGAYMRRGSGNVFAATSSAAASAAPAESGKSAMTTRQARAALLGSPQTNWTGAAAATNSNWSNSANWSSALPNDGSTLAVFGSSPATATASTVDVNYSILGLVFEAGAPSYNITGGIAAGLSLGAGGILNESTSSQRLSLPIHLSTTQTWSIAAGGQLTAAQFIGGAPGAALIKDGAGLLVLSAANTYTGGTTIADGIVVIREGAALGSGSLTMAGGELRSLATNLVTVDAPTINVGGGIASTFSAVAGGTLALQPSAFNMAANSSVTFGAPNFTGTVRLGPTMSTDVGPNTAVTVAAGTLLADGSAVGVLTSMASSTTIAAGATLNFNDRDAQVANLQGAGTLRTGGGVTGADAGILAPAGATRITVQSGDFSGSIVGSGRIVKSGSGLLRLSGVSTYSAGTFIQGGTLAISGGQALGTGNISMEGGELRSMSLGVISLSPPAITVNEAGATFSVVAGGTLLLAPDNFYVSPDAALTFGSAGFTGTTILGSAGAGFFEGTGPLTVAAGTLGEQNGALSWLTNYASSTTIAAGATMNLAHYTATGIEAPSGAGTSAAIQNLLGAGTLHTGSAPEQLVQITLRNGDFAGAITGHGLIQIFDLSDPGTVRLSGASTYTGGTVVRSGTLSVQNSTGSATGSGTVTVREEGRLEGHGAIAGAVTIESGGVISPGNSTGQLHVGEFSLLNGSAIVIELGGTSAGSGYDQLVVNGSAFLAGELQLSLINGFVPQLGDTFFIINILDDLPGNSTTGAFANVGDTISIGDVTFAISYKAVADAGGAGLPNDVVLTAIVVPEPATWLLVLGGLAALAASRRLRRKRC